MRCLTGFAIYMWLLVLSRSSDYWLCISPRVTLIALMEVEVCLGIPSCGTRWVRRGSRGLILGSTGRGRPIFLSCQCFPNKYDWVKLFHLMNYIRETLYLPLILSFNVSGVLKWWVDAFYAAHTKMQGNKGGGLSMGRGFPILNSTNHNLNTCSSTESEIVGVHDCMLAVLWKEYFLWKPKDTKSWKTLFNKTPREPLSWIIIGSHQVTSSPSTSTLVSFSSLTVSVRRNWMQISAPQMTWKDISQPRLLREVYLISVNTW